MGMSEVVPKTGQLMGLGLKSESDEFESKTHVVT